MATEIRPAINKHPRGLLDFFGIKAQGRYPGVMAEFVQPTIDLVKWYAELNAEHLAFSTGAVGATAAGAFILWDLAPSQFIVAGTVQVPDNEAWFVHNFHARANVTVATDGACLFWHSVGPAGNPAAAWMPPQTFHPQSGPGIASTTVETLVTLNGPIFLTPGSRLSLLSGGCAFAPAESIVGGMRVNRFLV